MSAGRFDTFKRDSALAKVASLSGRLPPRLHAHLLRGSKKKKKEKRKKNFHPRLPSDQYYILYNDLTAPHA